MCLNSNDVGILHCVGYLAANCMFFVAVMAHKPQHTQQDLTWVSSTMGNNT